MKPNLLLLVEVKQFLEEKLECTVDVIRNHRRIDSFFKQQIQKDGVEKQFKKQKVNRLEKLLQKMESTKLCLKIMLVTQRDFEA